MLFPSPLLPRTPLEIELPDNRLRRLRAWVVHSSLCPAGGWSISCRLYRELDEAELEMLLQARPAPQGTAERRVWVRCCCAGKCHVRDEDALPDVFAEARIRDISHGGIGLVLSAPVERGAILDLEFPGKAFNRVLLAWVAHVTKQTDETWRVGCTFAFPLDDNELRLLLHGSAVQ